MREMRNFVVLLVEDKEHLVDLIISGTEEQLVKKGYEKTTISFLVAETIPQADELFAANSAIINAILMDACVPGIEINTPPLVRKIREKNPKVPMIATSNHEVSRKVLREAGCNYESERKEKVAEKLLEVLGLSR